MFRNIILIWSRQFDDLWNRKSCLHVIMAIWFDKFFQLGLWLPGFRIWNSNNLQNSTFPKKKWHISNINSHKIHILKIPFFTKFTFWKSAISHFHKIHNLKVSFFIKFRVSKNLSFHKIHLMWQNFWSIKNDDPCGKRGKWHFDLTNCFIV